MITLNQKPILQRRQLRLREGKSLPRHAASRGGAGIGTQLCPAFKTVPSQRLLARMKLAQAGPWPCSHTARLSQLRPGGLLTRARPPSHFRVLPVLTSPTKCLQAAKKPTRSQQLVKNTIFLSINLEADSELLGGRDCRTIFSKETIFPRIKGTCL